MFTLTVKEKEETKQLEFETAELAKLYRDYHLAFGHWNGKSSWIDEAKVTPEMFKFVVDEMTEIRDGKLVRVYRVTDGIELILEKATSPQTILESWILLRQTRDFILKETDWTQVADNSLTQDERKEFRSYRQYLRSIPELHNDESIGMARVYSFEQWKEGKR